MCPRGAAAAGRAPEISKADVRGVISFYHDFHEAMPARHVLKLCRAEACQAGGVGRAGGSAGPPAGRRGRGPLEERSIAWATAHLGAGGTGGR
ncbi:MAG: NAD(P)H-dependent oxidoreductase subunit E [Rhodanobacteraceae bacterium]|nr:NAD(P)H-dependent oxidoreductase subunit E [Rhodanobacteraceae bacterium]